MKIIWPLLFSPSSGTKAKLACSMVDQFPCLRDSHGTGYIPHYHMNHEPTQGQYDHPWDFNASNSCGWRHYVFGLSVCMYMRTYVPTFSLAGYLRNNLTELLQIWYQRPLGLSNELFRFWWPKVKVHSPCQLTKTRFWSLVEAYNRRAVISSLRIKFTRSTLILG